MNVRRLFSLIIFLTFSFQVLAQEVAPQTGVCHNQNPQSKSDLANADAQIYDYTLHLCTRARTISELEYSRKEFDKSVLTGFLAVVKGGQNTWSFTPETQRILQSDGYNLALQQCFGNSEFEKKAFTDAYKSGEIMGHALGYAGYAAFYIGIYIVLKKLGLSSWAKAHPSAMFAVNGGLLTAGAAALAVQGKQIMDIHKEQKTLEAKKGEYEKNPDSLVNVDEALVLLKDTYKIVQDRLNQVNLELALIDQGQGDPSHKVYLLQRKAALEAILKNQNVDPTVLYKPKTICAR